MIKKHFLFAVLSVFLFHIPAIADGDKPVVIAMPPFCDFSHCIGTAFSTMALRDRVSAELFQTYNCIILSRSNGLTLSREEQLHHIKELDNPAGASSSIPAVDYALNGYLQIKKRNGRGNSVQVILLVTDMKNDSEKNWQRYESPTEEVEDVVSTIVKALNLTPKKRTYQKNEGEIDETWAVLPIRKLFSDESLNEPSDKHLAMLMELSLQNSGKLTHLVDHNDIDDVLRELKISSLNSATEHVAGGIASLLGADKVVMGTLSKREDNKKTLCLDLFLVDGKSTITLDSATAQFEPEELDKMAAELVLKFTGKTYQIPKLEKADSRSLKKESAIYENILLNFGSQNVKPGFVAQYVDTIFLLSNNNTYKNYKLGDFISSRILPISLSIYQQSRYLTLEDKKTLVNATELLLKDIHPEGYAKDVLLLRAKDYLEIHDTETALKLIHQHLKIHPDVLTRYANALIAGCYYERKDYEKVFTFLGRAEGSSFGSWVKAWTYLTLDNPANDLDELKHLKRLRVGYEYDESLFMARRIVLTHKIDGVDAAIDFATKKMIKGRRGLAEIQVELAKLYVAKGDKRTAKMIVDGINNEGDAFDQMTFYDRFENKKYIEDLRKDIKTLAKELDSVTYTWWKLPDVLRLPDTAKIYIQPVGTPDTNMVHSCVPVIEEKLGCKVDVLPDVPIPEDPYCYFKTRGQYNISHVWDRCRKAQKIPEDALMVVCVTEKNCFREGWNFTDISNSYGTGENSISTNHWGHLGNYETLVDVVSKAVLFCFNTQATNHNCLFNTCLFSGHSNGRDIKERNYELCDSCKESYKTVDFEDVKRDFHRKYNRPVHFSSHNRKEWQDSYNAMVKNILAKAEKEAAKPALPAVELDDATPGLTYTYYEFEPQGCKVTEHLSHMTPVDSGIIKTFSLGKIKRAHHFGIVFEGYIKVPDDGEYHFYLTSDDGSRLYIDGQEVINNDKRHSPRTYAGKIKLMAGYHTINVPYFQGGGSPVYTLKLVYGGPKTLSRDVPADVLFH